MEYGYLEDEEEDSVASINVDLRELGSEYKLVQLIVSHTQWNKSYCYLLKNNGEQGATCFVSWEPSSGLQIRYK